MAKSKSRAKAKPPAKEPALVATTGVEYQDADGKFQRLEAGKSVKADRVAPQALAWLTKAGFLVPEDD